MWLIPPSMASDFVRASGCSMKACDSPSSILESNTIPLPMLNGKVIPRSSLSRLWKRAPWIRHLYGAAILQISTGKHFTAWWTHSLQDTRARRGARQASAWDLRISGGSGAISSMALASFDRASSTWKMSAGSLVAGASELRLQDFHASGMTRSGRLYMRPPLEQVISGIASSSSGSWPTTLANSHGAVAPGQSRRGGANLEFAAKTWRPNGLWPTVLASEGAANLQHDNNPTLAFAVKAWSTPTASFTSPGIGMNFNLELLPMQAIKWNIANARHVNLKGKLQEPKAPRQVNMLTGKKSSSLLPDKTTLDGIKLSAKDLISRQLLNPNFTDLLMGWPVRWTSASAACDAAAMASWRSRARSLISTLCAERG